MMYYEVAKAEAWRIQFMQEVVEAKFGELEVPELKNWKRFRITFAHSDGCHLLGWFSSGSSFSVLEIVFPAILHHQVIIKLFENQFWNK